ncbi:MAG: hypothetical protein K2X47_04710 [Bdellovibrionales bacterium]|nr:hypothetical protein [Bdellovibrionales bacterium]
MSFQIRVHGKAIIAGEHAVIRGHPALVFPVNSCLLEVKKVDGEGPFRVNSETSPDSKMVLMGVFDRALQKVNRSFDDLRGTYQIDSTIPIGAGLGASAAICVAVARYCAFRGWVSEGDLFDFSRELENIFHGESSGVDIACALHGSPILYLRGRPVQTLKVVRPYWLYVSHCGAKGVTLDCVQSVKKIWSEDSKRGALIDLAMKSSVDAACLAFSKDGTIFDMAESFRLARKCFEDWGLTGGKLGEHMEELIRAGALAVKPTGSGGGGHVLSLWERMPSVAKNFGMLEVLRGD